MYLGPHVEGALGGYTHLNDFRSASSAMRRACSSLMEACACASSARALSTEALPSASARSTASLRASPWTCFSASAARKASASAYAYSSTVYITFHFGQGWLRSI